MPDSNKTASSKPGAIHVDLNAFLVPDLPAFDVGTIERWQLVNDLLVEGLPPSLAARSRILSGSSMLACLAVFPTLEEVARMISMRWDEDGVLQEAVVSSDNLSTWKPDGTSEPKVYKVGHRIVVLSHKLQLMHKALDPRLAALLDTLDQAFRRPMIQGLNQPMSPLYERLQYFRDHWLHGRRFEGWEALLVSFLLSLIYFGSMIARDAQAQSDVA
ncbi:MAG: hypothetical protein ING69_07980 [Rhodocyclaceae bacterium]|nr:hypothetical protein [Rhodocyclaceae bacterium]MCA3082581.1 hypothetical protein [Rhodocyclaceae bacterium]